MIRFIAIAAILAVAAVFILFEVEFDPRFQMPGVEEVADAEQEVRYDACVEEADHRIHSETFARIDNPDVQREILYRRMQDAKAACRSEFPKLTRSEERPLDISVIDLTWRF